MIYPDTTGKPDRNEIRLTTLERVWVQGWLRMWGRWSYIGNGSCGNMFNQLLSSQKITKSALQQALKHLKGSGLNRSELAQYLEGMVTGHYKSNLAFCTDEEALMVDKVIGDTFCKHLGLFNVIYQRYVGQGKSKLKMAQELQVRNPHWCLSTCQNRISAWLSMAEYMLCAPLKDAMDRKVMRPVS